MRMYAIVDSYLRKRGFKILKDAIDGEQTIDQLMTDVWEHWYKGEVPTFHTYKVYAGGNWIYNKRMHLNMAGTVCERWADLLLNEKVEIQTDDQSTQEVLDRLLKQTNFYELGNNLVERAFAVGGGYFVQYWDGKKVSQRYISQEYARPLAYANGKTTEVAFADKFERKGKVFYYINIHTLDDKGEYVIESVTIDTKGNEIADDDVERIVETHRADPCYQFIKPNIANKRVFNSPYGVSVFSQAIDVLKEIDLIFDSYYKEFLLGKKRIFVPAGTMNMGIDSDGKEVPVFDPNDEVFYKLPTDTEENEIKESNLSIRIAEHNAGMETQLGLLSQKCGFGTDGFKWTENGVTTATQIISQNSAMYRTLKKHEIILESAVIDMAKSLLWYEAMYGDSKGIKLDTDITVNFDDSIIEDTAEIKRQAMLELNSGVIDLIEYYKRVYKMSEEQAIKFRDDIKARNPQPQEEPLMEE